MGLFDKTDAGKSLRFFTVTILFEILIILCYGFTADYGNSVQASAAGLNNGNSTSSATDGGMGFYYPLFQDVHIMIFIGFGFLMTFVHRYSWSAVGLNFLLSAMALQWSMLTIGFFKAAQTGKWDHLELDVVHLIDGDFAAGAAMISFGAVLGKVSATQLVVMVFFEMIVFAMNYMVVYLRLLAIDMGGSLVIHTFGAYFGLTVAWVIGQPPEGKGKNGPSYTKWSSTLSIVGTIFLWCFWPSFNGALSSGSTQHRVVVNTILSIAGSCIAAFYTSRLLRPGKKFDFEEFQNATLAGGVAVGSSADLVLRPWGALVVGNVAGILSAFGFIYLSPLLNKHLKIHDTCGVHNLHGMPGILGGITGAISAAVAGDTSYGKNIASIFPARAPSDPVAAAALGVHPGEDRTASGMGGYQGAAIVVSIAFAIGGGLVTGYIMKLPIFDPLTPAEPHFDDSIDWSVHAEADDTGAAGHGSHDLETAALVTKNPATASPAAGQHTEIELASSTSTGGKVSLTVAQLDELVASKVRSAFAAATAAAAAAAAAPAAVVVAEPAAVAAAAPAAGATA